MPTESETKGTKTAAHDAEDEALLRAMTVETGSAFDAAHARIVERTNIILKDLGRGEKLTKLPRLQQALVRVARSYGSDRTVAMQIACEEITEIDQGRWNAKEQKESLTAEKPAGSPLNDQLARRALGKGSAS